MGVAPSVAFSLVEATPFRVRYLMTASGQPGTTVLPNANIVGINPDLRNDARGGVAGVESLFNVLSTPVANAAEARRVMFGDLTSPTPALPDGLHARVTITPRTDAKAWSVDADEGANAGDAPSAGFPVLVVLIPDNVAGTEEAYLDIHVDHTLTSSQ